MVFNKSSDLPSSSDGRLLKLCVFASLSGLPYAAAFTPLKSKTADSSNWNNPKRNTLAFVPSTSGGSLFVGSSKQTSASIISRSAVIQSYRLEDELHHKAQADAFSLLPARLSSSIKRIENPAQFQSTVTDEKDALVVVRFYAEACPSCKSTSPLFRKWSRDIETCNTAADSTGKAVQDIKIVEMPLNKATSAFMQDTLNVDQIPYCHLYHPKLGLVEEQLVMNKVEFREFAGVVDKWARGLGTAEYDNCVLCSLDELIEDCEEFC